MGFLDRLLGREADAHQRWIVVDVETSGMDSASDSLIAVGAVAMHEDGHVLPGDSLEIVIRQDQASSRENILVHGLGVEAQLTGVDPPRAIGIFTEFAGTAPIIAFHAPFDRAFLARMIRFYVNQPFDNPWLDLAELAPALYPALHLKSLDEWLARFGIPVAARHSAAGDAFATALLASRLLPEARRQGASTFGRLMKLARNARWLRG
jgi:DNA polymerase-3 subunit epsilon